MAKEALKKIYQLLLTEPHAPTVCDKLEAIAREALAQPVQEPVALVIEGVLVKSELPEKYTGHLYTTPPLPEERNFCPRCGKRTADLTAIHTCTPPQRPWVGLTDAEKETLAYDARGNTRMAVELAETKLKEKNT